MTSSRDYSGRMSMEMALEADGEKLRQLTGDDHGPFATPDIAGLVKRAESWDRWWLRRMRPSETPPCDGGKWETVKCGCAQQARAALGDTPAGLGQQEKPKVELVETATRSGPDRYS